jgi:aspartate aminotransferase
VISLAAGQPDFQTPPHVNEAAIRAIQEGYTKYTPVDGAHELKQAIVNWMKTQRDGIYSADDIVVTCGAKHAVYQSILAICDPGDEILLPVPYWVSYPEQINLGGGIAKTILPSTNDLKITADQVAQKITHKTKALILNSPANPSGAVYSKTELSAIADVIKKSGIYVISDEIYDNIVFDGKSYTSMTAFEKIRDQLIYINGVSKSYAMTGWRIGFVAAHRDILQVIIKYQGHSTTNPSSISQKAAVAAYRGEQATISNMLAVYQQRRDYVMQRLGAIKSIICSRPQGAFYAFPDVSAYYNKIAGITSSIELCHYLLTEFGVAIVPGSAFGMDKHVRLSFAASMEALGQALDRIQSGLESIF